MNEKVLIVEDQFVEANDIQISLTKAGYNVSGIARSVNIALKMIENDRPDLVLLDIFLKGKLTGIDLGKKLKEENIAFIYVSANSNQEILADAKTTEPYGFIVKPFREKDLLVTLEIAKYRYQNSQETKLRKESLLQKQLTAIVERGEPREEKLLKIAMALQSFIPFEYLSAGSDLLSTDETSFLRLGFDEYQVIRPAELSNITRQTRKVLDLLLQDKSRYDTLVGETFGMRSNLVMQLMLKNGGTFHFYFYSRKPGAYLSDYTAEISKLQGPLTKTVEMIIGQDDESVRDDSTSSPAIAVQPYFKGIVGNSHLLLNAFDQLSSVAPTSTSVLILGESGTGKERIAGCIHECSARKAKAFIKLNCAALPASLIESELFGHEKGSFTGAHEKRIGKFEQANGGTIFLDEIGEMSMDLQVKLLRVLQEKEIERIGSNTPIKIDVRIIAATNKDLEKEVAEGRFRLDLYYRLNVFPMVMPALRDRIEDIPALVTHFIRLYSEKTERNVVGITEEALNQLKMYNWPGNIRELEHLIERSILLSKTSILTNIILPSQRQTVAQHGENPGAKTFYENEREFILSVLKRCQGKVWGSGGAAEVLNVPPTTLSSKMKKLGIKRQFTD
ncbi:MAG: sigma 54-interacting response regulator [Bacteroidota bacterium]